MLRDLGCLFFGATTLNITTLGIMTLTVMEHNALKNVSNCLNTNIYSYSYLETSGGQSSNLHLNVVHFFNTSTH